MEQYKLFKQYNILIIEDDVVTLKYLEKIFLEFFRHVFTANTVSKAKEAYETNKIDIILSDIYLPKEDGVSFIHSIRNMHHYIPIVLLSACMEPKIIIDIIKYNISSFLSKPASFEEILRSLKDALEAESKKLYSTNPSLIKLINSVTVDLDKKNCKKDNKTVYLTKKEFELLELFIENKNSILDKNFIETALWGTESISESSVKTLIKKLRSKIGENTISTITNLGYKVQLESEF